MPCQACVGHHSYCPANANRDPTGRGSKLYIIGPVSYLRLGSGGVHYTAKGNFYEDALAILLQQKDILPSQCRTVGLAMCPTSKDPVCVPPRDMLLKCSLINHSVDVAKRAPELVLIIGGGTWTNYHSGPIDSSLESGDVFAEFSRAGYMGRPTITVGVPTKNSIYHWTSVVGGLIDVSRASD
jgi:hypothetical protein